MITTIMLNFIVLALLNYLTAAHLKVPETLHTPEIQQRRAAAARPTSSRRFTARRRTSCWSSP